VKTTTPTTNARFGTLLGAAVILERADEGTTGPTRFEWTCKGCKDHNETTHHNLAKARTAANDHAATCRALPAA
jgi:hypothetical protein